jgi:virulence factor Mce-like protein
MRSRRNSLAASPLLIGAITTLIVVVAVYLSYNANNGLPFVPTYNIKVALPEASELQASNQVRIGGSRVGVIQSMHAVENPRTGRVTAVADLKLEKKVEPLPADTKAVVQSVSAIGLKYLDLEKGTSKETLKAGATIPASQTREPVDIDELFNMFNEPTRKAIKVSTNNFGDGIAGRGLGLNNTIAELRPLVVHAIPALHNLALPVTDLSNLFPALDRVASWPSSRPTTTPTWTPSSRRLPESRGRSKKRPPTGPPRWNRRSTRCSSRIPSWKEAGNSCNCCSQARTTCARSRRRWPTRSAWARSTSPPPPP